MSSSNISFYSVPVAWVVAIAPHFYATSLGAFDNKNPRSYTTECNSSQKLDQATKDKIVRAEAAQQNGFENLGLFAAAVGFGNAARVDPTTLNMLSAAYLGSRVIYNLLYINGTNDTLANLRSVVYVSGIAIISTFFVKGGQALQSYTL